MKILITGSEGFIGRNLVSHFKKRNHILYLYDYANIKAYNDKNNIKAIANSDISKSQNFDFIPWSELDFVFHLAASGVKSNNRDSKKCEEVNVTGTQNLIDALDRNSNPPVLVYPKTYYERYVETINSVKSNPYIVTKRKASDLVRRWTQRKNRAKVFFVELFQVYGSDDNPNNLLSYIISQHMNGEIARLSKRNIKRDWIYIKDVVRALSSIVKTKFTQNQQFEIGTGRLTSIYDISIIIIDNLNTSMDLIDFDSTIYRGDLRIDAIAKNFIPNWVPKYNIEEGIIEMIKNMDTQRGIFQ